MSSIGKIWRRLVWMGFASALVLTACRPQSGTPIVGTDAPAPATVIPTTDRGQSTAFPTLPLPEATETATLEPEVAETPESVAATASPQTILTPEPALSGSSALAYLKDGDIWMLDSPDSLPYPLTIAGDILGFAWAPNGERLIAFNGRTLCFFHRDGSIRTACLELGLNDEQAKIERRLVLSPDQRWVVLWNAQNPQEEGAIGWMMVALDTSNEMYRVQDPVDWGAALTSDGGSGGFTGQALFLPDGRLIGTLSHSELCSSSGCQYRIFQFDFQSRTFLPFNDLQNEDSFSGSGLSLSKDNKTLVKFGTDLSDCSNPNIRVVLMSLESSESEIFDFAGESLIGAVYDPHSGQIVLSRNTGCRDPEAQSWASVCGLSPGEDILTMQFWTPETNQKIDFVPGIQPAWSTDGEWLTFRSCLTQDSSSTWSPDSGTAPQIYLFSPAKDEIIPIDQGNLPQWQP